MLAKKSCLLTGSINIVGVASSIFFFSSLLCSNIDISTNLASGQGGLPMVPSVKIVSPESGQQVPISISNATSGTNANVSNSLSISGTASDDANSPCDVSVLLNDVRPYQRAIPQGNPGKSDYSNWQFLLKPDYAPIKQGENKITAKLECLRSPANLTKWYSVIVTGVTREQLLLQEQQIQKQELEQKRQEQQALREIQLKKQTEQQMIERAKANAAKINQTAMFVTIESHKPGQHVPTDSSLTISGTSSDNVTTDCDVSVVLNSKTPYQRALPMNGSDSIDYSNWTFTFTPSYGVPKEGENEMTSRISCLAYPNNYTKFSSINITGVPQDSSSLQVQQSTVQQPQLQQSGLIQQHTTQQAQRYLVSTSNFVVKSVGR